MVCCRLFDRDELCLCAARQEARELAKTISTHISEVKDDPKLNAEQKEAQVARLQEFGQKLGRLEPLPENYTLVEQMKSKVEPIMNLE